MKSWILLCTSVLSRIVATTAVGVESSSTTPTASVEPLYVFPNGTAGENLLVRKDGSVLMTMIYPSALLYYFPSHNISDPVLLHNFTGSAAAYGIVEYAPDVFAVCTGTFSRAGDATNATGLVWSVDISNLAIPADGMATELSVSVSKVASISNFGFINGAALLNSNTILVADSVQGVIYSVDTKTGDYFVALNDTALAPNATGPVRLGVNGLVKVNDTLYFTNTNHRSVGKVCLNADGTAASLFTTIASNVLVDDLDVDPLTGAVYIASLTTNAITYVASDGTVTRLVGSLNSTDVPGPTSIRLAGTHGARDDRDARRLLISTSGGIEYPINGSYIQGGGLYELNIASP